MFSIAKQEKYRADAIKPVKKEIEVELVTSQLPFISTTMSYEKVLKEEDDAFIKKEVVASVPAAAIKPVLRDIKAEDGTVIKKEAKPVFRVIKKEDGSGIKKEDTFAVAAVDVQVQPATGLYKVEEGTTNIPENDNRTHHSNINEWKCTYRTLGERNDNLREILNVFKSERPNDRCVIFVKDSKQARKLANKKLQAYNASCLISDYKLDNAIIPFIMTSGSVLVSTPMPSLLSKLQKIDNINLIINYEYKHGGKKRINNYNKCINSSILGRDGKDNAAIVSFDRVDLSDIPDTISKRMTPLLNINNLFSGVVAEVMPSASTSSMNDVPMTEKMVPAYVFNNTEIYNFGTGLLYMYFHKGFLAKKPNNNNIGFCQKCAMNCANGTDPCNLHNKRS